MKNQEDKKGVREVDVAKVSNYGLWGTQPTDPNENLTSPEGSASAPNSRTKKSGDY